MEELELISRIFLLFALVVYAYLLINKASETPLWYRPLFERKPYIAPKKAESKEVPKLELPRRDIFAEANNRSKPDPLAGAVTIHDSGDSLNGAVSLHKD